jgi:hypothetical protein
MAVPLVLFLALSPGFSGGSALADDTPYCVVTFEGQFPCTHLLRTIDGDPWVSITFLAIDYERGEEVDPVSYRRLSMRIENTGEEPFAVDPARLFITDEGEGFIYPGSATPVPGMDGTLDPLETIELQPGETIEGDVWFSSRHAAWSLYYMTDDGRFIPIALLEIGGGGGGLRPTNRIAGRGRG